MSAPEKNDLNYGGHGAVAAAADLGYAYARQRLGIQAAPIKDGMPFIVLRDAAGNELVEPLDDRFDAPHRKYGTVPLRDAESFIAFYALHGNGSPVYASIEPAQFIAVLNDHTREAAGWRDHRVEFTLAYSKEWATWKTHDRKPFDSNDAFARFLEDNLPDVVTPPAEDLLAIALNFRMAEAASFNRAVRLTDGNTAFTYSAVVEASASVKGDTITIPETFDLSIPVWSGLGQRAYPVTARLRYRLRDGKLTIWYELIRPHKIVEQAFADLWKQIEGATGAPILHGTPE